VQYGGGIVLAIDPATRTGVASGRPGTTPLLTTIDLAREFDDYEDIFGRAITWFSGKLDDGPPELVIIEGLVPAKNHANAVTAIGLHAIFAGLARARKVPVRFAPVSSWRKYFLGVGKMEGARAKAECVRLCRQLGWDPPDHNAAEAAGIWLFGCSLLAPAVTQRHEPLLRGCSTFPLRGGAE